MILRFSLTNLVESYWNRKYWNIVWNTNFLGKIVKSRFFNDFTNFNVFILLSESAAKPNLNQLNVTRYL